jgi:5-hydroxyisourate hydrolase
MRRISTHILDIAQGKPASDVLVRLEKQATTGGWRVLNSVRTDLNGRSPALLLEAEDLSAGVYRLIFDTSSYFARQNVDALYPAVEVTFQAREGEAHFHIPLLLTPNGYTTYRGS